MENRFCSLQDPKSIPFYSLNDKLDADEITRQILFMKEKGMGGFFFHARGGLRTEYMSEEWFEMAQVAIDVAEREGMDVWFYDENGWPSGFAAGECLVDGFYSCYLTMEVKDFFDQSAYAVFAGEGKDLHRVDEAGENTEFYCVYKNFNTHYVDVLNPALTDMFIKVCHERYYERFSKYFGNVVKGFFTDEPQYSAAGFPFSSISESEFEKSYGYEMRDHVIALFVDVPDCNAFRHDYYLMTNRLFMENYTKKLYDWCADHNCMLTGHTVDEILFTGQMRWNGGVMRFYEYEHVPGVDHLSREIDSEVPFKQLTSVSEQMGRKYCISETFGASGHYSEPKDFMFLADMQSVAGISLFCQHLFPYTVRGIRKRDWPPFFSHHTQWNTIGETFYERLEKIGKIVADNPENVETLILHPIQSCYLCFCHNDYTPCNAIQESFESLVRETVRRQLPHHFGDEVLMKKYAKVENGEIKIGNYSYKSVMISHHVNLSKSTHELLKEFVRQGGKLYLEDKDFPTYVDGRECSDKISPTATKEEIFALSDVKVLEGESAIRSRRCGKYLYLVNSDKNATQYATYIIDSARSVCAYDILNEKESAVDYKIENGKLVFSVALQPRESVMYKLDSDKECAPQVRAGTTINVLNRISLKGPETNYFLMDKFYYSLDGEMYFGEKEIYNIANELMQERYEGDLYLKKYFICDYYIGKAELLIEENPTVEVYFNKEKIELDRVEDIYNVYDITGKLLSDQNELIIKIRHYQSDYVYKVMYDGTFHSLKNNLVLDTELENVFIRGNFGVSALSPVKVDLHNEYGDDLYIARSYPIDKTNITANGYPFIKDKFVATLGVELKDTDYSISVDHTFDAVRVIVNGKTYDMVVCNKADISDALVVGLNEIKFEFCPTSQLFYGPHRREDLSNPVCGPFSFGYEAVSGSTVHMSERIYVKKQGINGIYLIKNVR